MGESMSRDKSIIVVADVAAAVSAEGLAEGISSILMGFAEEAPGNVDPKIERTVEVVVEVLMSSNSVGMWAPGMCNGIKFQGKLDRSWKRIKG